MCGRRSRLLLLALFFVGPSLCFPQESGQPISTQSDKQIIERLLTDLTASLQESNNIAQASALQLTTFNQLKAAYDKLAQKLPVYEQTITTLQDSLDRSATSLAKAQADLQTATQLLQDYKAQLQMLSDALSNYKSDTDKEVQSLRLSNSGWEIAGITFGVISLGEGVYIAGHLLGWWK